MSSIKLSTLCTHSNTYFNVCASQDKVVNRGTMAHESSTKTYSALTIPTAVYHIGSHQKRVFSWWPCKNLGVTFKENSGDVLSHIYLAKTAKSRNEVRLC